MNQHTLLTALRCLAGPKAHSGHMTKRGRDYHIMMRLRRKMNDLLLGKVEFRIAHIIVLE